jgi:(p)ppGpp synthase/HD superfamily hydrolase
MCHLTIAIDQSLHTAAPVFDALDSSEFYIRSIRMVPTAWSRKADLHLSLGGGSRSDLDELLARLKGLPAVLSAQHTDMPV